MSQKDINPISYFLGGATWDGKDQYKNFIEKGIWRSGWGSRKDQFRPILEKIKKGDRIAIKKAMGPKESNNILIRSIGIVKSIDLEEEYCTLYVDWILTNLKNRKVFSHGCYKTIHGPYSESDWTNKIFCL